MEWWNRNTGFRIYLFLFCKLFLSNVQLNAETELYFCTRISSAIDNYLYCDANLILEAESTKLWPPYLLKMCIKLLHRSTMKENKICMNVYDRFNNFRSATFYYISLSRWNITYITYITIQWKKYEKRIMFDILKNCTFYFCISKESYFVSFIFFIHSKNIRVKASFVTKWYIQKQLVGIVANLIVQKLVKTCRKCNII